MWYFPVIGKAENSPRPVKVQAVHAGGKDIIFCQLETFQVGSLLSSMVERHFSLFSMEKLNCGLFSDVDMK